MASISRGREEGHEAGRAMGSSPGSFLPTRSFETLVELAGLGLCLWSLGCCPGQSLLQVDMRISRQESAVALGEEGPLASASSLAPKHRQSLPTF